MHKKQKALGKKAAKILRARSADKYVELIRRSGFSRSVKTELNRLWRAKTGVTADEIALARSRNKYLQKLRNTDYKSRNQSRWDRYNYLHGKRHYWTDEEITSFLNLDSRHADGSYRYRDREIAEKLFLSIPSVQHWRRKRNLVDRILALDHRYRRKILMHRSEGILRSLYLSLSHPLSRSSH